MRWAHSCGASLLAWGRCQFAGRIDHRQISFLHRQISLITPDGNLNNPPRPDDLRISGLVRTSGGRRLSDGCGCQ